MPKTERSFFIVLASYDIFVVLQTFYTPKRNPRTVVKITFRNIAKYHDVHCFEIWCAMQYKRDAGACLTGTTCARCSTKRFWWVSDGHHLCWMQYKGMPVGVWRAPRACMHLIQLTDTRWHLICVVCNTKKWILERKLLFIKFAACVEIRHFPRVFLCALKICESQGPSTVMFIDARFCRLEDERTRKSRHPSARAVRCWKLNYCSSSCGVVFVFIWWIHEIRHCSMFHFNVRVFVLVNLWKNKLNFFYTANIQPRHNNFLYKLYWWFCFNICIVT